MADTEARVREMFKKHISDWRESIKLLEEGRLKTSEAVDGIWTDTTIRTIVERKNLVKELEDVLASLKSRRPNRRRRGRRGTADSVGMQWHN